MNVLTMAITSQIFFMTLGLSSAATGEDAAVPEHLSFNEHVRPILSNHCWSCHGPDEETREAGLRLDLRDSAVAATSSGNRAIVPGQPESSELVARIESVDHDLLMPPDPAKKPLTDRQKLVLKRWIREGAEFAPHWAFVSPTRPQVPPVRSPDWPKNAVDHFVLQQLESVGLQPSPEAAPETWLRRVSLDLTGLPPSLDEQEQFQKQLRELPADAVYSSTVDRLLQSPRYAERMAMHWLDAARFADTNGYNNDETRTMWPWRDWLIQAFAQNMPYDQFIIEQLAGDLLPDATLDQQVASGFNRNHVLTTEGGIIEEEYHAEYVADRVHTTATVFLALSMQCARCHDHKYDPITQKEYYQFAAYFNNVPDRIVSYSSGRMAEPLLKVPTSAQRQALADLELLLEQLQQQLDSRATEVDSAVAEWEQQLTPDQIQNFVPPALLSHFSLDDDQGTVVADRLNAARPAAILGKSDRRPGKLGSALNFDGHTWVESASAGQFDSDDRFSAAAWILPENPSAGTVLSRMDDANSYRGYDLMIDQGQIVCHLIHRWPSQGIKVSTAKVIHPGTWHHVVLTYDGSRRASGLRIYLDGALQQLQVQTDNVLTGTLLTDKPFHIGRRQQSVPYHGLIDEVQLFSAALSQQEVAQLATGQLTADIAQLLALSPQQRNAVQREQLRQYYLMHVDEMSRQLRSELADVPVRRKQIEDQIPVTMIMAEMPEVRSAFVLKRGQYDQRGEQVQPALPQILMNSIGTQQPPEVAAQGTGSGKLADGQPVSNTASRLDLARLLTDPHHPLTSRVAVNRWWEMLFGIGLVETSEDFGIQGAVPSHPELLDWLAVELVEQQWNQQVLLKQLVLSATYRQSSKVTPQLLEKDPENRRLGRGPRYRLPAEMVRDHALFVSGLLNEQTGGASVRPWQPEGLWEDVSVERREKYVPDIGDGRYRRSMYTFWKRTCPPPAMTAFDAPDRETCVIRRARTNTPLQALVLLNDPTYIEAARALATRILLSSDADEKRAELAFRYVLARLPQPEEQITLLVMLAQAAEHFDASPAAAQQLLQTGLVGETYGLPANQLAAWTTAISVLLNTDEAISKP